MEVLRLQNYSNDVSGKPKSDACLFALKMERHYPRKVSLDIRNDSMLSTSKESRVLILRAVWKYKLICEFFPKYFNKNLLPLCMSWFRLSCCWDFMNTAGFPITYRRHYHTAGIPVLWLLQTLFRTLQWHTFEQQ